MFRLFMHRKSDICLGPSLRHTFKYLIHSHDFFLVIFFSENIIFFENLEQTFAKLNPEKKRYVMKFALIRKKIVELVNILSVPVESRFYETLSENWTRSVVYTAHFNLVLSRIDVYNILITFLSQSLLRNCKQFALY